jgi:antitoxin VapB
MFPKTAAWSIFLEGLNNFSDDFMADGRQQPVEQMRESI